MGEKHNDSSMNTTSGGALAGTPRIYTVNGTAFVNGGPSSGRLVIGTTLTSAWSYPGMWKVVEKELPTTSSDTPSTPTSPSSEPSSSETRRDGGSVEN